MPRTAAGLLKSGSSPAYRTHQRRAELEAARGLRWRRSPHSVPDRRPLSRLCFANHCRATDRGHNADWLRKVLAERQTEVCIPSKSNRKIQIPHDHALYCKRRRTESMFGKLKHGRRIATRHDRCAHTFISAIARALIAIFWTWKMRHEPRAADPRRPTTYQGICKIWTSVLDRFTLDKMPELSS